PLDARGSLCDELRQVAQTLGEGGLAALEAALVGAVLDLDADRAVVADVGQNREERVPVDVAEAGQLRRVVLERRGLDADLVQSMLVEAYVLGVDVEEAVAELAQRREVVDVQPDAVRRVEVQPEALARDLLEHAAPDRGRVGQVLAARPLVAGEEHRTVLDADLD